MELKSPITPTIDGSSENFLAMFTPSLASLLLSSNLISTVAPLSLPDLLNSSSAICAEFLNMVPYCELSPVSGSW